MDAATTNVTFETIVAAYPTSNRSNLLQDIHQQFPRATSLQLELISGVYKTSIPPTIEQLDDLESIVLIGPHVYGHIPLQVCGLRNLKVLSLQYTAITRFERGFSIANLRELQTLIIENNPQWVFSATDILEDVSQPGSALTTISLNPRVIIRYRHDRGEHEMRIPETIGNLQQLTSLTLHNCQLKGPIPHSLFTLHNLQTLRISRSNFRCALQEDIGNFQRLTELELQNCEMTGPIPASICQLSLLEKLNLRGNGFEGSLPENIGNLGHLTDLNAEFCGLSGAIPESIGRLTNLRNLDLRSNQLTGGVPQGFRSLTNLQHLSLGGNNLTEGGENLKDLFFHVETLEIVQNEDRISSFSRNAIAAICSDGRFSNYVVLPGGLPIDPDVEPLAITDFDAVDMSIITFEIVDGRTLTPETRHEISTWDGFHDNQNFLEICRRMTFLDVRTHEELK
jgi:Leucine-rich repeat (LRR) protein